MDKDKYDSYSRRNFYRKQRNIVRRILLLIFISFFIFCSYKIFLIPIKTPPRVEIIGNFLIQDTYLVNCVNKNITKGNFFLVSPKQISNDLLQTNKILKDVVVRKYLIPECKLIVFFKEKTLWAELLIGKEENVKKKMLIATDGDLASVDYLNLNLLPKNLLPIYVVVNESPQKSTLNILKRAFDLLHNDFHLDINKMVITETLDLEIYPTEKLKIRAGKVSDDLFKRISKLKDILNVISEKSYVIKYLDLTLEEGAVFKSNPETNEAKKKFSLFQRKSRS